MSLSPIIVFAYNRPEHLKQTLTALSGNVYADQSILFIYCDGPKPDASEDQLRRISEVRSVAAAQAWCKEVHIVESTTNKGLANSIIGGVSEVIKQYGRVIVLEDDLVTSPSFLKYMNESLDYYEKRKAVFSIGGFNFAESKVEIPEDYDWDNYVSLRVCTWGWATWIDRWEQVDWTMDSSTRILNDTWQCKSFNHAGDDMTDWLNRQLKGELDSWGIRFAYAHFANHSVVMMPCRSLVQNNGFDGSGVHCGKVDFHASVLSDKNTFRFLDVLYEDERIINSFYSNLSYAKRPLWQKAVNHIARKLGKKTPFKIKKKLYCQ